MAYPLSTQADNPSTYTTEKMAAIAPVNPYNPHNEVIDGKTPAERASHPGKSVLDLLEYTLGDDSADKPDLYFPAPDPGYVFANTGPSDPAKVAENAAKIHKAQNAKIKPSTRQDFDSKGSIEQPADGPNAMREEDKCLTCIWQGGNCRGTEVRDGRCKNCQGETKMVNGQMKRTRNPRGCRWKRPADNIYTYQQHKAADGSRTIAENSSRAVALRGINLADVSGNIFDFEMGSYERQLVEWIAEGVFEGNGMTVGAGINLNAMIEMTIRRIRYIDGGGAVADAGLREEILKALDEIFQRLCISRQYGHGIEQGDIVDLLPVGHPHGNRAFF